MAILHVTARADGLRLRGPDGEVAGAAAAEGVARALDRLPEGAPVAALIHGFRFDPDLPGHDPHACLFHPEAPGAWPRALGFSRDGAAEGLCIAFGWQARAGAGAARRAPAPRRAGRGALLPAALAAAALPAAAAPHAAMIAGAETAASAAALAAMTLAARAAPAAARRAIPDLAFAEVYDRAAATGRMLGDLIGAVRRLRPDLSVDMLAHSLGARIALHALQAEGARRAILLGAAVHAAEARALAPRPVPGGSAPGSPASGPEIINVSARGNALFDALFEAASPRPANGPRGALGRAGLGARRETWIDLQLDDPAVERWLAARGHVLGPARRRMCHWSFYERAGAMALWSEMLRGGPRWAPEAMRRAGAPEGVALRAPGWTAPRLRRDPREEDGPAAAGRPA